MDLQMIQVLAGTLSSAIFTLGAMPMLIKARRTKNLRSYSLSNLVLMNFGNAIYWLYVASLPLGPIWFLHTFWTVTSLLMLIWYRKYTPTERQNVPRAQKRLAS